MDLNTQREVLRRDDSPTNLGLESNQSQYVLDGAAFFNQFSTIRYDEHVHNGPMSLTNASDPDLSAGYLSQMESHSILSTFPSTEPMSIVDQQILEEVAASTGFRLPILSATNGLADTMVHACPPHHFGTGDSDAVVCIVNQAAQDTTFQVYDSEVTTPICHGSMNGLTPPFHLPASNIDIALGSSLLNYMPLDARNLRADPFLVPTSFGPGPNVWAKQINSQEPTAGAAEPTQPTSRGQPQTRQARLRYSDEEWEHRKPIIRRLYLGENRPLIEVIETMKEKYGFQAT